jgi:hypothetical protein
MKIVNTHTLLIVGLMFSLNISAQNNYQTSLNDIFEINANKVTTGVLIERAPMFVDISRYSKSNNDKDTCDVNKWRMLYHQVYLAHLNLQQFAYNEAVLKSYP